MKIAWKLVLASIFFSLCFRYFADNQTVEVALKADGKRSYSFPMLRKDRRRLEAFFRSSIIFGSGGYTLLGSKPLSFDSYCELSRHVGLMYNYMALSPDSRAARLGWKTWLKYQHHFEDSPYALWVEQSLWIENGWIILLADREKVVSTMREHREDFEPYLRAHRIDKSVIEDRSTPLFSGKLQGHEGLIGTLLGYGRDNGWKFSDRCQYDLRGLWDGEEEEEKLLCALATKSSIARLLSPRYRNDISKQLSYVSCLVDPSSKETALLRSECRNTREKIIDYYRGKNFLEATLSLLKYGKQLSP